MSLQFVRNWLAHGASKLVWLGGTALLGTGMSLGTALPTQAAQDIVFTYGPLGRSISIEDLTTLAETGEAPRSLRWYLRVANLQPETLQTILNTELGISLKLIDRVFYSLPGEFVLHEVGQVIRTPSNVANIQALRGTLIVSASEDNKVSLLEFLQNYPTPQLYIDGVKLVRVVRDVNEAVGDVKQVANRILARWALLREFLDATVCDCETPAAATAPTSSEVTESNETP